MKGFTGHPPAGLGQAFRRYSRSLLPRMGLVVVAMVLLGSIARLTVLLPNFRDNLHPLR